MATVVAERNVWLNGRMGVAESDSTVEDVFVVW